MTLEGATKEGDSPVGENYITLLVILLEYLEVRTPWGNPAGLSAKAKYYPLTDSELVPWGKGEK